jgi:Uma2 family endonuclease
MSTTISPAQAAAPVPAPLLTAEEFAQRSGNQRVELVKGVVKELPMPFFKHGEICGTIAYFLIEYARKHNCARVATNDSFVKTQSNPDTVRGGDILYYSDERLPKGAPANALLPVAPDLIVEVRSPSDLWTEIFAKVSEYLGAGVRVVIVLDAVSQTASVYRNEELQQIFHNSDELVVPEVLPGFAVAVSKLFE